MVEINYAENDRQIQDNPSAAQARRLGSTHCAYGWARSPWGHWSDERKADYDEGYDAQKKIRGY